MDSIPRPGASLKAFRIAMSIAGALAMAASVATQPLLGLQDTTAAGIQGVLRDEATGRYIAGGIVRLLRPDGTMVRSVESNRMGGFLLRTPGPGTFRLQARRTGFKTRESGAFTLPQGHLLSVEVLLTPAPQDTATALIEGVVLDERTGTPVPQSLVRLQNLDGETLQTTQTDWEGRFSLRTPGPGTFHLQVSGLGYQTKETGGMSLPSSHVLSVEIRLTPAPLPLDSVEVMGRRRPLRPTEQLIQGRLLDYGSQDPIPQGNVLLLRAFGSDPDQADLVQRVITDNWGLFSFITPRPGTYRLRGERIGYETTDSPYLHMMPGDTVVLDFYLDAEAIVLDPITVRASARPWANRYDLLGLEAFFDRQARFGNSGFGSFLTRDSLASYEGRMDTSRMLLATVPEVRMVNAEGGVILAHGCNPRYYLDGVQIVRGDPVRQAMVGFVPSTPYSEGMDPELMYPPESLEAVEVYVSPTIPVEFSDGYPCGVVSLWTKRR